MTESNSASIGKCL